MKFHSNRHVLFHHPSNFHPSLVKLRQRPVLVTTLSSLFIPSCAVYPFAERGAITHSGSRGTKESSSVLSLAGGWRTWIDSRRPWKITRPFPISLFCPWRSGCSIDAFLKANIYIYLLFKYSKVDALDSLLA